MPHPIHDPEAGPLSEVYAIVYTPRRQRDRFPENCVEVVASAEAALAGADPDHHRHPARVIGPSRSSEGLRLYYLVGWL